MSREIERERIESGSLSEDEIRYLQERDRLPANYTKVATGQFQATPVESTANTGTVATMTTEDLEAELERRRVMQEAAGGGFHESTVPGVHIPTRKDAMHVAPNGGTPEALRTPGSGVASTVQTEDDDEDDGEYGDWTNNELRAEIARRNDGREEADKLSLDGKKADLIATLEADDEADDEANAGTE
jgi:hypothetical protein